MATLLIKEIKSLDGKEVDRKVAEQLATQIRGSLERNYNCKIVVK